MPGDPSAGNGNKSVIRISVYDGARRLMPENVQILYRVRDGNQKERLSRFLKKPSLIVRVPFFDNFGDMYTVIVSSKKCHDAGFTPVKASPLQESMVDLMLLPKDGSFRLLPWDSLGQSHKPIQDFLSLGVSSQKAKTRYEDLKSQDPPVLAALLNVVTAMGDINLPSGTPLDYYKELLWDQSMKQDRFFGFADQQLVEQVKMAVAQGVFRAEPGSGLFHPGATSSYKQIQFGEANVQLTFHEKDVKTIGGVKCVELEADIDYFQDPGAHALLEVIPNTLGGGKTDPKKVYVLRWIAGRHAGIPEFDPPYTIEV